MKFHHCCPAFWMCYRSWWLYLWYFSPVGRRWCTPLVNIDKPVLPMHWDLLQRTALLSVSRVHCQCQSKWAQMQAILCKLCTWWNRWIYSRWSSPEFFAFLLHRWWRRLWERHCRVVKIENSCPECCTWVSLDDGLDRSDVFLGALLSSRRGLGLFERRLALLLCILAMLGLYSAGELLILRPNQRFLQFWNMTELID